MSFDRQFAWQGPNDCKFTDQHGQEATIEMPRYSGGGGGDMEARVAKLEAHVEHIKSDVTDIKADVREVRKTSGEIKDSISSAKIWALLLYFGLAAGLLGVMAKGFGWL